MTEGEVDHHDPVPVYQQLAAIIRGQIERGELTPRSPLPSESYLQQRYGVARGDTAWLSWDPEHSYLIS